MERILSEINDANQKLMKSFDTLKGIEGVEIAESPKTEVYAEDKIRLFNYDRTEESGEATVKTPIIIVYALVNTYKMLDLQPDRSYIKAMLANGHDVYLIDWGYPSHSDKFLTIDDYVNGYINNCVDVIRKRNRTDKVNIISICQGGTLSVIYTSLHQNKVRNLVTQVTPVDFETNDALLFRWSKDMDFDKLVEGYNGLIPGEFLNEGFAQLKPMMKLQKHQAMVNMLDSKEKLENFLRMEKWINDSPNQAGECFRQFMKDLYQKNLLVKNELIVGGKKVNLKNITCPVLNVYATEDHLVPPAASKPLCDHVGSKDTQTLAFKGGHIGVFVGSKSQKELVPAVSDFLKKRDK